MPIRVPGARASTFSGAATLRSCLSFLLGGRCRLGCFARSFAAQQFTRSNPNDAKLVEIFPIGLPYPEVFAKRYQDQPAALSVKKGVTALVIVLNYLYLGRPTRADATLGMRTKLSQKQWEVVHRFESFLQAWNTILPVTPEVMGRTAGKVESLEDVLAELEFFSKQLSSANSSYFGEKSKQDKPGTENPDLQQAVGRIKTEVSSTFKPVDPSRLNFVGRPCFDPTPYLDSLSKKIFLDPCQMRRNPDECSVKPPRLRVHCSRAQKVKLFELLDASQRLQLHLEEEVTPLFGSGLFAVTKDLKRDRLILDSRGANLLESPPERWIKSLGSAETLTRICLEPWERLLCSGNDLRDFYYLFGATPSRARRNVLVGALHPQEVAHLHCAKAHHLAAPRVYGSLGSLAMGDCQAVELAQSCHVGMGLQWDVITADNLLTMTKPIPRSQTMTGVVIDDFIALSKVDLPAASRWQSDSPSEGAELADRMQLGYEGVDLIPNASKAFRDLEEASFWGVDLDGRRGFVRGSLKRAIPLCSIILKVVELGYSSADLMEIIAGSLVSLVLFRRRFLSLMDNVFSFYRGKPGRDVFKLDGKLKSDLLCLAILLPMAVTNLRASPPAEVAASDASNWGEAGVVAKVNAIVGKELVRHSLRKSVWNRLLSPHKAWLRSHEQLSPEEELPEDEDTYETNPLWSLLATGLSHKPLFAKRKRAARHINIGELRAALKTEKLLSRHRPSGRFLLGVDSQVALGALIKGRSSSRSLNSELIKSIPHMLALDSYLELMYYHTSMNRADQPTRGTEIEPPSTELPRWWAQFEAGDLEAFDKWLHEKGLDDLSLAGLPDLRELCGNVSPKGIFPLWRRESSSSLSGQRTVASSTGGVAGSSSSTSSAQLPEQQTVVHGRSKTPTEQPGDQLLPPKLSRAAKEMLGRFKVGQVVLREGESWPPDRAGFFSGKRGVATALQDECNVWTLCFDIEHGANEDLSKPDLRTLPEQMLRAGCFAGVGGGPVCRTFSMAVRPPVRSKTEPFGKADVSEKMKAKIAEANDMALWCIKLMDLALHLGLVAWLENPGSSWFFRLPDWKELELRWPSFRAWTADYCRYGTPWRKRTKFFSNTGLAGAKTLCSGCERHQLLQGRSKEHQMSWTLVAQPYPDGICRALALGLLQASKLIEMKQTFDPASCAKAGAVRIGEASHPGPRQARAQQRPGILEEVPLVEPKTKALQDKVWGGFIGWLNSTLTPGAVRSAMSQPCLLVLLAKEYGNELYSAGRSLYVFRHLLVFMQQNFLTIRPFMGVCWSMVTRWELMEPTVHRTPLPYAIFCAMISVAIGWRWFRFAGILGLGFHGIARPGEPLRAFRSELILPRDTLDDSAKVVYLKILKPKTRQRGRGTIQHISIHNELFNEFLDRVFGMDPPHVRLLDCTASAFRRRWDAILTALCTPKSSALTPGGVRGGGCVHSFQQGTEIPLLLWRMRIRHLQTLESYLQEVVASTVVSELPLEARQRIATAAALSPHFLRSSPHAP